MIPCGPEWIRQPSEDPFPVVGDLAGLAVHEFLGTDDFPAEGIADALVAQAYPQDGDFPRDLLDDFY